MTRFTAGYLVADNGCWIWQRGRKGGGYGAFTVGRKSYRAHRWAYEQLVGPVPDGLVLDHLCCNKLCVNPAHLEPVTHAENARRHWRRPAVSQGEK